MQTKIESLTDPEQEKAAFDNGLALSEFAGLFVYFLQETPEGRQAKKDLEKSWQDTFLFLKENKKVRGNDFSCVQFIRQISKELLAASAPAPSKKNHLNVTTPNRIKEKKYQQKPLRFKNV